MEDKIITKRDIVKRIKECHKRGVPYNWLGFVENKTLTSEVVKLFSFQGRKIGVVYNWVNGNDRMKELIKEIKGK